MGKQKVEGIYLQETSPFKNYKNSVDLLLACTVGFNSN